MLSQFEEGKKSVVMVPCNGPNEFPRDLSKEILGKLQNITCAKLANELPPMHTTQHSMDMISRVTVT